MTLEEHVRAEVRSEQGRVVPGHHRRTPTRARWGRLGSTGQQGPGDAGQAGRRDRGGGQGRLRTFGRDCMVDPAVPEHHHGRPGRSRSWGRYSSCTILPTPTRPSPADRRYPTASCPAEMSTTRRSRPGSSTISGRSSTTTPCSWSARPSCWAPRSREFGDASVLINGLPQAAGDGHRVEGRR